MPCTAASRWPQTRPRSWTRASEVAEALDGSFTGWGVSWSDLDLDTDLDLVLANGAVPVTNLGRDAEPAQVLESRAAQGSPATSRMRAPRLASSECRRRIGRGSAAADYDNDGDVDVAVNSIGDRLVLLRNTAETGNWLEVALRGFQPGAEVTAMLPDGRELRRELHAGSSYLSSEDPRLHFGLGGARLVRELVVRFPGGAEKRLERRRRQPGGRGGSPVGRAATEEAPPTASSPSIDGCTRPPDGRTVGRPPLGRGSAGGNPA